MKMVYSVEQDTFIVMFYYRNGTFVNGKCVYSITTCKQEYLAKYPDLQIQETSLEAHMRNVISRFVHLFELAMGNLLEDLQYLRKLLMI